MREEKEGGLYVYVCVCVGVCERICLVWVEQTSYSRGKLLCCASHRVSENTNIHTALNMPECKCTFIWMHI